MVIVTVEIDLAKKVFAAHGVKDACKPITSEFVASYGMSGKCGKCDSGDGVKSY